MSPGDTPGIYSSARFVLTAPREKCLLKIKGPLGEVTLNETLYPPVLDKLAENGGSPKSAEDLLTPALRKPGGLATLTEILACLIAAQYVFVAQPSLDGKVIAKSARRFNNAILDRAGFDPEPTYFASPVIGSGVASTLVDLLFTQATVEKNRDLIGHTWSILSANGRFILKDGKPIESPDENQKMLHDLLKSYQSERLPLLRRLGIVEAGA